MSRKDDMTVRFSGLKPGVYNYDFKLDNAFFEECENEEMKGGNVDFAVEMERKERFLMFVFRLKGEVVTWCDRCLGEMRVPVEGEERLCVRFSDTEVCDDEDVVVLPESAFEIDLSQWLYEYVAVRMPMQHVHSEGECDPATVQFITTEEELEERRQEETDPRWEALKDLK